MNEIIQQEYKKLYRVSRITLIVTTLAFVISPFLFSLLMDGSLPSLSGFLKGILRVAPIYFPVAIVEFLVYAPMLGKVGTPIAFVTGEITNLKIPCVMNARDLAKTPSGSMENEVVSTISVCISALVIMSVVFLGVVAMIPLTPVLQSETLRPAYEVVIPALFGALGFKYFKKSLLLTSLPLFATAILCIAVPAVISQTSMLLIPVGGLALLFGFILYKKGKLDALEEEVGL